AAINLLVGYQLGNRMPDVVTPLELGYRQTHDLYAPATAVGGLRVAGTIAQALPAINPRLLASARLGLGGRDEQRPTIRAGAGLDLNRDLDRRGEYIKKDASSVLQASLVYHF